jgi:hypothetical protein
MEEKSSLMKRVPELSCEEDQSKAKGWPKGQRVLTQARAACEFLVEFVLYPVVALASAILATSTYGQTFTLLALLGAAWWGLRQAIPKSVSKLRQTVVLLATLGLAYWAVEGFLNFRFTPDVRNKVPPLPPSLPRSYPASHRPCGEPGGWAALPVQPIS